MLQELSIKDVVLITELQLDFNDGLSALTGETGAGKSILLDSMGLALGHRAEAGLVRKGCDKSVVTAQFLIPRDHHVISMLREAEIALDDEEASTYSIILKRVLTKDGRSKAYINDQSVSVKFLSDIGAELVDIHGQFETHGLMNPKAHSGYLDLFGDFQSTKSRTAQLYDAWHNAQTALKEAQDALYEIEREEQWLRSAHEELEKLAPIEGEEEELLAKRGQIAHHASIVKGLQQSVSLLEGAYQDANTSTGAMPNLHDVIRSLTKVEDKIGQSAAELISRMDSSYNELSDILSELKDQLFQVETGDHSLDMIDERLHSYRVQARKHRSKADDLPELLNELSEKLSLLDGQDGKIAALEKAAQDAKQDFYAEAQSLSEKRKKAALKFDKAIMKELPALKLASAEFQTDIQDKEERLWNADGIDDISFTVKTNAGSSFAPLNKCASGGELSRIMLALKVVLSAVSPIPVMVFDEVDSGIGGATAAALGDRLAALSQNVQLLVITHAPQIAARAITHMVVSKRDIDKNQTETTVSILNGTDQRRDEIARMLSGENITDEARAAAQSLIDSASPAKKAA